MKNKEINIKSFVNSYLITAAWVTCDSDECQEFTRNAKQVAKEDCEKFIAAVIKKFGEEKGTELLTIGGNDLENLASHDFFLARNHHGADFRDKIKEYRGYEIANELVKISQDIGGADCYHINGKKSKLMFN